MQVLNASETTQSGNNLIVKFAGVPQGAIIRGVNVGIKSSSIPYNQGFLRGRGEIQIGTPTPIYQSPIFIWETNQLASYNGSENVTCAAFLDFHVPGNSNQIQVTMILPDGFAVSGTPSLLVEESV